MISALFLGLLLGMQHALEADHLAAVASLATQSRSRRGILRHGFAWGVGHMLTLTVFAGAVIISQRAISPSLAGWLESAVGVMLVLLGASVLRRLYRERVHFHVHRHDGDRAHLHAHSHADDVQPHDVSAHDHEHPRGVPLRSLAVGMMHGLAGSAALVVLAAAALNSPIEGLIYVALFGIGSVGGMALLSFAIAIPMRLTAHVMTWTHRGVQGGIGCATIVLGGFIILG